MNTADGEGLMLHAVGCGAVAKSAGMYFHHGHPVPEPVVGVLDQLIWSGLVAVAADDPLWEARRLSLTDAGQARYAALSTRQPDHPQTPPPEHASTPTPAGWRFSTSPMIPASGQPDSTLLSPPERETHRG